MLAIIYTGIKIIEILGCYNYFTPKKKRTDKTWVKIYFSIILVLWPLLLIDKICYFSVRI